mmetsp:Transcript_84256/g.195889  ORF Transcript_84256/g.195889 Transcript_84256/m.195889 type:complete len:244 (-) Transcript_84256:1408-2139(-)
MPDPAPTVDCLDFRAWDQRVYCRVVVIQVVADDLTSRLTEAQRQERPELDNGILQDLGLQRGVLALPLAALLQLQLVRPRSFGPPLRNGHNLLVLLSEVGVTQPDGSEGVLADRIHLEDHPLNWQQDQLVCIPAEEERPNGKNHDNKARLHHVDDRLPPDELAVVVDKDELPLHVHLEEASIKQVGREPHSLLHAKLIPRACKVADHRDPNDLSLRSLLYARGCPRPGKRLLDVVRQTAHNVE